MTCTPLTGDVEHLLDQLDGDLDTLGLLRSFIFFLSSPAASLALAMRAISSAAP